MENAMTRREFTEWMQIEARMSEDAAAAVATTVAQNGWFGSFDSFFWDATSRTVTFTVGGRFVMDGETIREITV